jgi:hypothetical protein
MPAERQAEFGQVAAAIERAIMSLGDAARSTFIAGATGGLISMCTSCRARRDDRSSDGGTCPFSRSAIRIPELAGLRRPPGRLASLFADH